MLSDASQLIPNVCIEKLDFFYGDTQAPKQVRLPLYTNRVTEPNL